MDYKISQPNGNHTSMETTQMPLRMEATQRHTLPADLATALRETRRRRGLGLRATARSVGISHGYLHFLENGSRCPSVRVAELLIDTIRLDPQPAMRVRAAARPKVGKDSPLRRR